VPWPKRCQRGALSHNRVQELLTQRDFPRVAEHVRYHVDGHGNHDEFGYVLDLILDGLAHSNEGAIRVTGLGRGSAGDLE